MHCRDYIKGLLVSCGRLARDVSVVTVGKVFWVSLAIIIYEFP